MNFLFMTGKPPKAKSAAELLAEAQKELQDQDEQVQTNVTGNIEDSTELSLAAKNRQTLVLNLFDGLLPSALPDWELLAQLPLGECLSAIRQKQELGKEDRSDLQAIEAITQDKVIPAGVDNNSTILHEARFLRGKQYMI